MDKTYTQKEALELIEERLDLFKGKKPEKKSHKYIHMDAGPDGEARYWFKLLNGHVVSGDDPDGPPHVDHSKKMENESEDDSDIKKSEESSKEIGRTESGKSIQLHKPDLNSTSAGGIHGNKFKNWTKEDHADAYLAHHKEAAKIFAGGSLSTLHDTQLSDPESTCDLVHHVHNKDAHYFHVSQALGSPPKEVTRAFISERANRKVDSNK